MTLSRDRLRVYIDADVLLAGIATESPSAASRVILEASELTLLDLLASRKVLDECERNLSEVAPEEPVLGALRQSFREVVARRGASRGWALSPATVCRAQLTSLWVPHVE